jgi:hypothetical protein
VQIEYDSVQPLSARGTPATHPNTRAILNNAPNGYRACSHADDWEGDAMLDRIRV